jgi:CRISPR-associated protein Cmr1
MHQIEFECEVLTPLFLGGADARLNPELRAPSFRGALRYWYRALAGGSSLAVAASDTEVLKALKCHEESVFGTTEKASALILAVTSKGKPEVVAFQKDRAIRTPDGHYLPTGKDYLLWSMAASGGRPGSPRYQPDREHIKPGTRFSLTLRSRRSEEELNKAKAAFWLLANLGALGARANRGAGSIQGIPRSAVDDSPEFRLCRSVDDLKSYLSAGVRQCLSVVSNGTGTWRVLGEKMPSFAILSPGTAEVWVVAGAQDGWESFTDALNGIGSKLRDYRSHRAPVGRADHDAVLRWLEEGGVGPQVKRAAFGLPISFRYSEGGPSDVLVPETSDRRASPLRIRVTRLETGRYVGVLALFKSRFLEESTNLRLQTRKWKAPPPTDYKIIQDFVQTFEVRRRVTL